MALPTSERRRRLRWPPRCHLEALAAKPEACGAARALAGAAPAGAPKSPPCWAPSPVRAGRRARGRPGRPCPCWRRHWTRDSAQATPSQVQSCLAQWIGQFYSARGFKLPASLGSWLGQSRPGQARPGQVRYLTWPKSRTMRVKAACRWALGENHLHRR